MIDRLYGLERIDAKKPYKQTKREVTCPFIPLVWLITIFYMLHSIRTAISAMQWSRKNETSFSKGLSFTYDGANRLLGVVKPTVATYTYVDTESGISYESHATPEKWKYQDAEPCRCFL